ncbi:Fe-S cluster assembly protein SufD [Luteimonas aquatica]|uniref:Fe-S cluster assembly protein SufD n=1 Tax=Luteimonas aquatica TaxID=450364 RepID=UPI001F56D528|nr:Fe-S cluster assembly protein SufD [Luteimonas aquatica]
MSALLQSLRESIPAVRASSGAAEGDAARQAAVEAVLRDGLPGPRSEAWKYTPLRALERRAFAPSIDLPAYDEAVLAAIPAPRLVFVNGRFDAARSDASGLPAGVDLRAQAIAAPAQDEAPQDASGGDAIFARLNDALAETGVRLRVGDGAVVETPLHLVFVGAAPADGPQQDLAWHLRHDIEIGDNAALALVEHHLHSGAHRHLANARVRLRIGTEAWVQHVRIQAEAEGATAVLRTDATLAREAAYHRLDLELGTALSRHELHVRLEGAGARLHANGVLLAAGRRHLDTRLAIEHAARDTACSLLWRGIGAGRGHAVFHGGITILEGADGSDASLSNKNLLLSESAEIDTQPVLVIHADEVKAAHGATVGQLDPTAMFYLRSRGLPADAARRLLTAAFAREPLSAVIAPAELREAAQAQLDAALQGLVGE